jgi:hypothetical protein
VLVMTLVGPVGRGVCGRLAPSGGVVRPGRVDALHAIDASACLRSSRTCGPRRLRRQAPAWPAYHAQWSARPRRPCCCLASTDTICAGGQRRAPPSTVGWVSVAQLPSQGRMGAALAARGCSRPAGLAVGWLGDRNGDRVRDDSVLGEGDGGVPELDVNHGRGPHWIRARARWRRGGIRLHREAELAIPRRRQRPAGPGDRGGEALLVRQASRSDQARQQASRGCNARKESAVS